MILAIIAKLKTIKTGLNNARVRILTKIKQSVPLILPALRKHGDILLLALALAVLVSALIRTPLKKVIPHPREKNIQFTLWQQGSIGKEYLDNFINEFESIHKNIKIYIKETKYEELKNDLFDKNEGISGDILALDTLWIPELNQNLQIESINAPVLSFINVLYYNVNILREAGFTKPPKSRNDFLNCARAVADRDQNRWGLAMDLNSSRGIYDDIFPWIYSSGVRLIKEGKPALTSRQVIESLSFLSLLNGEGLIGVFSAISGDKLQKFISGRTAFMIAPACWIEYVRKMMGEEAFGITSVPAPDGIPDPTGAASEKRGSLQDDNKGKIYFSSAGWTVGISSSSVHREEALLFRDFIAEKAVLMPETTGAIPETGVPMTSGDPLYSKLWDIAISGEIANDFTGLPWNELDSIFREELLRLFSAGSGEQIKPDETAAAIQERWEKVIN